MKVREEHQHGSLLARCKVHKIFVFVIFGICAALPYVYVYHRREWPAGKSLFQPSHPVDGIQLLFSQSALNCSRFSGLVFVREFFNSNHSVRAAEVVEANVDTIRNNACSKHVFVIVNHQWMRSLKPLCSSVLCDIYHVTEPRAMQHLLRAVRMSAIDPANDTFVLSTGDVSIGPIEHLPVVCADGFQKIRVDSMLVISRSDGKERNCSSYASSGSWDVEIAAMSRITEPVLEQLIVAPTYWGVENVVAYLFGGVTQRVYNLCPFVKVIHHHKLRTDGDGKYNRIRINHAQNTVDAATNLQQVDTVCKKNLM